MEKYYIVSNKCSVGERYLKCRENEKIFREVFKKFAVDNSIVTRKFYTVSDRLHIVPTDEDIKHFSNYFMSNEPGRFKKS
ncbi:MAG: hypothetical protein II304_01380, partial [Bacteroidales bacterium]|nr:hypothetical protein [Bacteroidales bacterium]